ncbi:hypothetical protein AMATHDRAFT_42963 [Amanita thiersii Skay4041]|uniref:GED domain-containing protein n=1 Tax=Amanita thiersii Skay4041 TaxID=703135 RepID=A0A2A9NGM1_9AGAR|nr:hypothetical protein AMATHDRAFT_42963 [Amanita thiersii Skay4041]
MASLSPSSDTSESDTSVSSISEDSTEIGVGLANPKLDRIRRNTLDLVNKLHNTGVQVDIDLPQIAVVGQQSAGKSSLIESISGITLPRAAGTCTRCPTECRLSQSNKPWQCIVSLRFTVDANGQPLGQARNEVFGPVITKKSKVEERIRRAQRAILNPSLPPTQFLNGDDEDIESELSFSSNCVSLQISGPDVADLSFCDLPGLIASVRTGGNTNDIQLVENLVTSYIKKSSCIILLTVACETDFENQGAHRLTKQYDPDGMRAIGVLTKPDRIQKGEEGNWIAFIKNDKEPLENNWFCVKQPSSTELKVGLNWQEARRNEDTFFSSTSPWSELEGMYQQFLRTRNLVQRLSTVLSDLVLKRLPEIQDELEQAIARTETSLSKLPKEPSKDPLSEIMNLIYEFTSDVSRHANGVPEPDALHQLIRPEQEYFRTAIRDTIPAFIPFKKASQKQLENPSFLTEEESGNNHESAQQAKFTYYIDEVLQKAQAARTRELPGHYPFSVQMEYIKASTKDWGRPALDLCHAVHKILATYLKNLIHNHFSTFGQGTLEQRVRVLVQDHLKKCVDRTEEKIRWLVSLEKDPSTSNTHYLADYRDKFLAYYKTERAKERHPMLLKEINSPHMSAGVQRVLEGLAAMSITAKRNDIAKILPSDKFESALEIMADVRAYTQGEGETLTCRKNMTKRLPTVAYKRFVDYVPCTIDVELIRGTEREILKVLYSGLGIFERNGPEVCKELSKENPSVAHKREELKMKLERLNTASRELLSMGR